MALRADAVAVCDAEFFAFVDAGDLVGERWLDAAQAALVSCRRRVIRPELIITFGRRSGSWPQREWHGDVSTARLLASFDPWAGVLAVSRDVLSEVPLPRTATSNLAARMWNAALIQASIPQETMKRSVAFVRVWDDQPTWESASGPVLAQSALLTNREIAAAKVPRHPPRKRVPTVLARIARVARSSVRPWRDAAARCATRRRAARRFAPEVLSDWRSQNAIEPLLPYPRPMVGEWYEKWGAPWPTRLAREADAYWNLLKALPPRVDYLFFAPWVRTGGGDRVLSAYLSAVERLDEGASVALVTTEDIASTRLDSLPPRVAVVQLRDELMAGVPRQALVDRILPQLIAQLAPHTIHAFNSTVALDIFESYGRALAPRSNLYISTFAIDRTPDGERTSVLFLRSPDFLEPVTRVLTDSDAFVQQMVQEQGYDPAAFIVQRQVIASSSRSRHEPARFDRARPLRMLWAGRFDVPKRLDVLARVATELRGRGLPVEVVFCGEEVMGDPTLGATLASLAKSGAERRPAYAAFAELPLADFDVVIMTSEWEGLPLVMLEAMGSGIPVIAPLVGGVGEVLNDETGYPIVRFDDVGAYVEATESILTDYAAARARASRARALILGEFSSASFDARLCSVHGYLR
ncbi:glycosyltransferase family 4 protein [Microbacterium sp. BR1]|uniref:glycosyltransferase family 4 protein n=1 Tax=Microbacterium sp. BR1 TaxID=1070896 RepID=UPI0012FDE3D4|nr:glycosyltransferase family 4 protein [Microbacterium sp. BR1]